MDQLVSESGTPHHSSLQLELPSPEFLRSRKCVSMVQYTETQKLVQEDQTIKEPSNGGRSIEKENISSQVCLGEISAEMLDNMLVKMCKVDNDPSLP